jgi:exodeoxyribonuclease VII small subunit
MNRPPEEPRPFPPTHAAESAQPPNFEEGLAELGRIVTGLESGSLGLAESITAYERGVTLVRQLHDELSQTEARVNVLVRIDEEGRPVLAPHAEAAAEPLTTRPAKRPGRGKASRSRPLPGMDEGSDEA